MDNKTDSLLHFETEQVKVLIELLRVAVFGKKYSCTAVPDWQQLIRLAQYHMITACIADVAKGFPLLQAQQEYFKVETARILRKQILFDEEKEKLYSAFEQRHLFYLPLKGDILSSLYPLYAMREFFDCDIFMEPEAAAQVADIFRQLGYHREASGVVHDSYQKPPVSCFEIHRRLFPKTIPHFSYFESIRSRVTPKEDGCFWHVMTPEDEYLYIVAHLAKHSFAGFGFRSYMDFALYYRYAQKRGLDWAFISDKLQEMELLDFERTMIQKTQQLFWSDVMSLSDTEVAQIALCGATGSLENYIQNSIAKNGGNYCFRRLFPPCSELATSYPILRKLPLLYPLCAMIRLLMKLISAKGRKQIKRELRIYHKIKRGAH